MSASAENLLTTLCRQGVRLSRNGNKLRVRAPATVLTDSLLGYLRGRKAELLDELTGPATRDKLVKIAEAEGIDSVLVRRLPNDEIDACVGWPAEVLTAYIRAIRDTDLRKHGLVPADEMAAAMCRFCGPVWLHPAVAAVAPPVVDGRPSVLGCPWCHVHDRSAIPHPPLPGIES